MNEELVYIYKITNDINNIIYIGSTKNIDDRFRAHKKNSINKKKGSEHQLLYEDMDKYGVEHFSVKCALAFLGISGHSKLIESCRSGEEYRGYYWKKEWKK